MGAPSHCRRRQRVETDGRVCRIQIHVRGPNPPHSDMDAALRRLLPLDLRLNDATAAFLRAGASVPASKVAELGWSMDYARAMDAIAGVMPRVLALLDSDDSLVVYAHVSHDTRHLAYMGIPLHIKQRPATLSIPPGVLVFHGRRSMFFTHDDILDEASARRLVRQVVSDAPLTCCACGAVCRVHTACCRQCAAPLCGACNQVTQCPMCSCELAPF